jgi:hypothetical protein
MTKRLFAAIIGLACTLVSAPVGSATYDDDDDVVRESRPARPAKARTRSGGGATASRTCLKPEALALLQRIEAQFGPLRVVSTCRPGARIAGSGKISKHATGQAVDFYAPNGRKAELVRWLIANHNAGGTMTYAHMGHIHVDIGYRFVSLGSGGGRATRIARRATESTVVASNSESRAERVAAARETGVASYSERRAQRLAASRELRPEEVLRLAQRD